MKKLSLAVVVLFFVGMDVYGQSCANDGDYREIKGKSVQYAPGGEITVKGGVSGVGGSIILKPGDGMNEDGDVIMDLASGSSVGIGTSSPLSSKKLHIYHNSTASSIPIRVENNVDAAGEYVGIEFSPSFYYAAQIVGIRRSGDYKPTALGFLTQPNGPVGPQEVMRIDYNGNVGIGTTTPAYPLTIDGDLGFTDGNYHIRRGTDQMISLYATSLVINEQGDADDFRVEGDTDQNLIFVDSDLDRVGIGTSSPQSKLTVDGTITTREMKVKLTGWPDFVFADNYNLMPLNKLEKHIKEERSLPGIPTNKEVIEDGVLVGEMQAKLLEKVEELTLYVIELNKKVEDLREENEGLKEKISTLNQ